MHVEKYLCKNINEYINNRKYKKYVKYVKNVYRKIC